MEDDEQRQIDRACAAQSPEMLPETKVDKLKIKAAQERVNKQKAQYTKPARIDW